MEQIIHIKIHTNNKNTYLPIKEAKLTVFFLKALFTNERDILTEYIAKNSPKISIINLFGNK